MREKIVAGNWKMYKNPEESRLFIKDFLQKLSQTQQKNIFIFPQTVCIEAVHVAAKNSNILIGAQNCSDQNEGALTGETSPLTLKQMGCHAVLVGHSERRTLFGETNLSCAKKIQACQTHNLIPMYCVGETLPERKSKKTFEVLKTQLHEGLRFLDRKHPLIIAYEPVWAIGTGEVASPEQAQEAHQFIRSELGKLTGPGHCKILYGGSVKPENAAQLIKQPDIDGFLVGGASLKIESFAEICQISLN